MPFTKAGGGLNVALRLSPRARADRIAGIVADEEGSAVLKVGVTAAPEGGKANAALIRLLAKEWRLPKSAFSIAAGAGARRKVVHIAGDADTLLVRLKEWTRKKNV